MPSTEYNLEEFEMWGMQQPIYHPFDNQASEQAFVSGIQKLLDFVFLVWYISPL